MGRWVWGGLDCGLIFLWPEAWDAGRARLPAWSTLQSSSLPANQNMGKPSFSRAALLVIMQNCEGFFGWFPPPPFFKCPVQLLPILEWDKCLLMWVWSALKYFQLCFTIPLGLPQPGRLGVCLVFISDSDLEVGPSAQVLQGACASSQSLRMIHVMLSSPL